MAEGERADDKAGYDFVADAQEHGGIERLVREGHGGGERDDIAGKQREFHAGLALGDAVAHRRHAARDQRDTAGRARGFTDDLGEVLVRLVGGKHVVIGGDNAKAGAVAGAQHGFVAGRAGGKTMRLVGATQRAPLRTLGGTSGDALEIFATRCGAAGDDAVRDGLDVLVQHGQVLIRGMSCRLMPPGPWS